jgi:hypothetical protein
MSLFSCGGVHGCEIGGNEFKSEGESGEFDRSPG